MDTMSSDRASITSFTSKLPVAAALISSDGLNLEFANSELLKLIGIEQDESQPISLDRVCTSETTDQIKRFVRQTAYQASIKLLQSESDTQPIEVLLCKVPSETGGFHHLLIHDPLEALVELADPNESVEQLATERELFNEGPVTVFKWQNAANWPVEYTSKNIQQVFGYESREFTSGELLYASLIHPDDMERVISEVTTASADPDISHFNHEPYRLLLKSGEYHYFFDHTRIIRDEDNEITHYHGYLLDISGHMKTVEKLNFFNTLVNSSRDPIYAIRASDFSMAYVNKAACEHFGKDTDDLLKLRITDWDPTFKEADLPSIAEQVKKAPGPLIFQTKHIVNDDQVVDVEVSASLVEYDNQEYFIGYTRDITDRKLSEERLKQSEAQLQAIFNNSQVGIMLLEGYRIFVKGNQRLADILGYDSPDEMMGFSMRKLHLSEERFIEYGEKYYNNLCNHDVLHAEYQLKKKNGDPVWCVLSGKALDEHTPADLSKGVLWVIDEIDWRKNYEHELITKEAQIRAFFNNVPYFSWMKDTEGRYLMANAAMSKASGIPLDQIIGATDYEVWPKELAEKYIEDDNEIMQSGQQISTEEPAIGSDGKVWVETYKSPIFDQDHKMIGTVGIAQEITERIQAAEALKQAEERSRLLLEHTNEGIFGIDPDGVITFLNPAAARMLGYDSDDLIGNHIIRTHSLRQHRIIDEADCRICSTAKDGQSYHVDDEQFICSDGSQFPVEYWSAPIYRNSELVGAVVTFHDISKRLEAEERIRYMAYHDPLTELPNRRLFQDHLKLEINNAQRYHTNFAVMLLDLDHFKEINDTLGHPLGDELLQNVSTRLSVRIRRIDTVARLGGDEFIILQSHIDDASDAAILADHIIKELTQPFYIQRHEIQTGVSIGIVTCMSDERLNADDILSRCDIALYRAKESGRGNYVFFEHAMTERVQFEAKVAKHLSLAAERNEFRLVLQPKLDLKTDQTKGYEALIRWSNEALGDVSPAVFIPIAEKRGLIDMIGQWVIETLCNEIKKFHSSGHEIGPVAFNLSQLQLQSMSSLEGIQAAIEGSGLPSNLFEIEITETAYTNIHPDVLEKLEEIVKGGVKLSIDDFGTGYSSMISLRKMNASFLKIDREFIRDMMSDQNDRIIVNATIQLAHSLKMQVIAEGVETQEQLDELKLLGCDMAQGYLICRPLEFDQVTAYINAAVSNPSKQSPAFIEP